MVWQRVIPFLSGDRKVRIKRDELVVPTIILLFSFSYWIQVKGQTRVVVLIPYGALVAITILSVLVIGRDAVGRYAELAKSTKHMSILNGIRDFVSMHRKELGLVAISIGYFLVLSRLGFTLDNVLFLLAAFSITGLNWRQKILYTVLTSLVLFGAADLMQLNVPHMPWFLR
jgi:hypothetical protein